MRQHPSVRSVDVLRIAAEIHRDPRTVVRAIEGRGTRNSRSAVDDAAGRLNIQLPPPSAGSVDDDDDE